MPLPKAIREWKGGKLRIYGIDPVVVPVGTDSDGQTLYEFEERRRLRRTREAFPYGEGLAISESEWGEIRALEGEDVWLRIEMRRGRPQVVAIESKEDGPPLT